MATVVARRAGIPVGGGRPGAEKPSQLPLTLADLITAVQDLAGPEDGLVVATVRHLLRSGQLTGRGTSTNRYPRRRRRMASQDLTGGPRRPSAVADRFLCCRSSGRRGGRGATANAAN